MKKAVCEPYKGYVYFIVNYSDKRVKIGYSINPAQRVKQLMTAYPGKRLEVAKQIKGNVKDERKYQKIFCHYRIEREWFVLSEEILEFIKR